MTLYQFLTIIGPIVAGFLGVGGVGAYYSYKASKPKTSAEAQKINAEVVLTFADGWKSYAEKLETRLTTNEVDILKLQRDIRDQDEKNRMTLQEKDRQIDDLQSKNRTLERRVSDLELELSKYKQTAS